MRDEQPRRPDDPQDDEQEKDRVTEASEESFPASDPPSWDPSHAGTPAPPEPKSDER